MTISTISVRAIALALPAVLGLACTHARSRPETAAAEPQGTTEEQEAAAMEHPPGHAADRMVSGRVTRISSYSVSIEPMMGEERTLEIVPQTVVTVDGRQATPLELTEGQEVRASFNQVEGRDVAVRIESLNAADQGGSGMPEEGTEESPTGSPDTGETTVPEPPGPETTPIP
jgi:hypothetical protein